MIKRTKLLLIAFVMFLITIYAGALLGYGIFSASNRIARGVSVLGIDVGNRTVDEARALVEAQWQSPVWHVSADGDLFPASPADLGLPLPSPELWTTAVKIGRETPLLIAPFRLFSLSRNLMPAATPDWEKTEQFLVSLAPQISRKAQNATLQLQNGVVVEQPAQNGRELMIGATLGAWQREGEGLWQTMELVLLTQPLLPTVLSAESHLPTANTRASTPITLSGYDPFNEETVAVPLTKAQWESWLAFTVAEDRLQVEGKSAEIGRFLQEQRFGERFFSAEAADLIASAISTGQNALELRLYHSETTHTIEAGETLSSIGRKYGIPYPWLEEANPHLTTLRVGQAITIPSRDALIPLPVVKEKRIKISIAQQKMWAYERGALVWEWPISTGIAESPTSPGIFQVQSHEIEAYANSWELYMPYFMGIYRPAPTVEFMNGFHGFPTRDGRNLLWTNSLGRPATYGCILVDNANIPALYEWAEDGVVVEITES